MRKVAWILCAALTVWTGMLSSAARADDVVYNVTMDTTPLETNPNAPFYLDFTLAGQNGNTVTISNFTYGGGAATGSPVIFQGDASGSISSSVTLDTLGAQASNELYQSFTPGSTLSFTVTSNNIVLGGSPPDQFLFQMDYGPSDPTDSIYPTTIQTDDLTNSSFLSLTYNQTGIIQSTFGSPSFGLSAPQVSAAPLPPIWAMGLALTPMLALGLWQHQRRGSSIHTGT